MTPIKLPFLFSLALLLCTCGSAEQSPTDASAITVLAKPVVILKDSPGPTKEYRDGRKTGGYALYTPTLSYISDGGLTEEIPLTDPDSSYVTTIDTDRELTEVRVQHRAFDHYTYYLRAGDTLTVRFGEGRLYSRHVGAQTSYPDPADSISRRFDYAYPARVKLNHPMAFVALGDDPAEFRTIQDDFMRRYQDTARRESVEISSALSTYYERGTISKEEYLQRLNELAYLYREGGLAPSTLPDSAYLREARPYQLHYNRLVADEVIRRARRYPPVVSANGRLPDFARVSDELYEVITDSTLRRRAVEFNLERIVQNSPSAVQQTEIDKYERAFGATEFVLDLKEDYDLNYATVSEDLLLVNHAGEEVSFRQILARNDDHLYYVDFWASWCAPCRAAFPASREMHAALAGRPVTMLYLSTDLSESAWRKGAAEAGLNENQSYKVAHPKTSKWLEQKEVRSIPRYMVMDGNGKVLHHKAVGPGVAAQELLISMLE